MKKCIKRIVCCLLTASLLVSMGCGKKNFDNSVEDFNNLQIVAIERGYGTVMIEKWAERFHEINPEVNVKIIKVVESSQSQTYFELGPEYSDYDIFFDISSIPAAIDYGGRNAFKGYEGHALMNYTEFYNSKVYNEDITLAEKMNPSALQLMKGIEGDDDYYAFPFAIALQSLILNEKVTAEALGSDYNLPNTTDELWKFANDIKDAGYTAFAYPGQLNYWQAMYISWWAQYEGIENYERFYKGQVYDETQEKYIYSADIYKQQGRLESLKVMEKLLMLENGLHLAGVNDYNVNNFTALQKAFLNSDAAGSNTKKYAMFPNGDWIATESGKGKTDPFIMMQLPVISSIIKQCTTISDDAELSKLIDAIDRGDSALEGDGYSVNQKDFDKVKEARNIIYGQMNNHIMYSPVYSNARTLIGKFLAFIASDEGIKIYYDNVRPGILPLKYDYPESTDMFINSVKQNYNKYFISKGYGTYMHCGGGGIEAASVNSGYYEAILGVSRTSGQYRTAQQIYDAEIVSEEAFNLMLQNAGLRN